MLNCSLRAFTLLACITALLPRLTSSTLVERYGTWYQSDNGHGLSQLDHATTILDQSNGVLFRIFSRNLDGRVYLIKLAQIAGDSTETVSISGTTNDSGTPCTVKNDDY